MSEAEEKRLYKLTDSDVDEIVNAMASCTVDWELAVRTGADWTHANRVSVLRSISLESPRKEGEGYALGVFFNLEADGTVLGDLGALNDVGVSHASVMTYRGVSSSEALIDLSPLQSLTQLTSLVIGHCDALTDLSPLESLTQVTRLDITRCEALTDLSPLESLTQVTRLDISRCEALTDLSPLESLTQVTRLNLGGCYTLTDLSPLQSLTQLTSLDLDSCRALTDLSPLQSLTQLTSLNLHRCSALTDLSPLQSLTQLTSLSLNYCSGLTDLSPLQSLTQLTSLNLDSCSALTDLSPLQSLTRLTSLNLSANSKLTDLSPLQSLMQLTSLDLSGDSKLTELSPLQPLTQLTSLSLNSCRALTDLSPLQSLTQLTSLDLDDCPDLADNSKWEPLESLSGLRELKGSFPSHTVTRLLARNAADAADWVYVHTHLAQWKRVAGQHADQPGLLTAIGRAAALNPAGHQTLARLLTLAATHDAPDVDGLFAVACPLAELSEEVGAALTAAVEQADGPLPPETLIALHEHLPTATTLRDQTLMALRQTVQQTDGPGWSARTAQALRERVQDDRYPITRTVRDAVAQTLQDQTFGALELGLFGALCSDHGRAEAAWRDPFHQTLVGFALAQSATPTRNQAFSDLAEGLARAGTWGEERLDGLLEAAATVDPDTSTVQVAVAQAHATAERWDAAERAVYAIARPAQRDACLKAIATRVLSTELSDRARRAVALEIGLSDPFERVERLVALGSKPELLADPVAYGQLVALLTEQPKAQQQVITTAIEHSPAFSDARVPDAATAVTEREQRLLDARDAAWSEALHAEAPDAARAVEGRVQRG